MASTWNRIAFDFSGLDVLVTGGTAGIGAGVAATFAASGARVTVTGTRASAQEYDCDLSGYRYEQFRADVADDAERLAARLDALDILVNNAGDTGAQPEDFMRTLDVNLGSVYRLSRACAPLLCKSTLEGGASVVNMSSFYAYYAHVFFPGYGAAKAAIVNLTQTLAAIWSKQVIRVNCVVVGSIASRMTEKYIVDGNVTPILAEHTLLDAWGDPSDIAGATLFLSSPAARFITGTSLAVDGGYSAIDRYWGDVVDITPER